MTPDLGDQHREFEKIKAQGLKPNVHSMEEFIELTAVGKLLAAEFLQDFNCHEMYLPSVVREVHGFIFREVFDWAGEIRRGPSTVDGLPCSDPMQIEPELILLSQQIERMLGEFPPQIVVAFGHLRFERVHPHRDGNGRCGRTILGVQNHNISGTILQWPSREDYFDALKLSQKHKNLTWFADYLLTESGRTPCEAQIDFPYRLAPRFFDGPDSYKSIPLKLDQSQMPCAFRQGYLGEEPLNLPDELSECITGKEDTCSSEGCAANWSKQEE